MFTQAAWVNPLQTNANHSAKMGEWPIKGAPALLAFEQQKKTILKYE